ncbi:homeodomain-like superfamily protein [Artemisia annua]|uniref:Homeodomain-like superfamily protein n=1 Tax=Artemisia annua TaxID=35608 RepID=A0A2U1N1F9_ARTAN|nr:homeodomain-like superfamily protein [Artemisia annua]
MDDVSIFVQEHRRRPLEATYEAIVEKESEASGVSSDPTPVPDKAKNSKSKKRIAAELAKRSKKQLIALVPKPIASLAIRFFPIFNPALFPHKPPALSVANRVLFTDAEDGLLARGIMEHNTDWKEIQKNHLPCKTPHQIFVRQKNLSCSRALKNPVKDRRKKVEPQQR